MWAKLLSLLGLKKKPFIADLFQSFTYPTMTDLTKQEHLNLEYTGVEEDEDDDLDEMFEIVQRMDHEGNVVDFCVLGEIKHNHGYYLVCKNRHDLATEDFDLNNGLLILQVFAGMGSDKVYHEVQHHRLQEQIIDAFIAQENPENY